MITSVALKMLIRKQAMLVTIAMMVAYALTVNPTGVQEN
jgi:hypothetical protein